MPRRMLERLALSAGIARVLLKPCLPQLVLREVEAPWRGLPAGPDHPDGSVAAGPLKQFSDERHPGVRHDQDHRALLVGHAEREHFRTLKKAQLPRRKVSDGQDEAPFRVHRGDSASMSWADDFLMPISGPKSICSRYTGFRASGKGSARTMRPTRMSTRSKSANVIVAQGENS